MPVSPAARPRLKASAAQRPPPLGAPQHLHGLAVFSLRSWQVPGGRLAAYCSPEGGPPPSQHPDLCPWRKHQGFLLGGDLQVTWTASEDNTGLSRSKSVKRISNPVCKNCVPLLVSGPAPQSCLWEKHQPSRRWRDGGAAPPSLLGDCRLLSKAINLVSKEVWSPLRGRQAQNGDSQESVIRLKLNFK